MLFDVYNCCMNTFISSDSKNSLLPDESGFALQILQSANRPLCSHRYFEIIYILDGEAELVKEGEKSKLSLGDCRLIAPNTQHSISSQGALLQRSVIISNKIFEEYLSLIAHQDEKYMALPVNHDFVHLSVSEVMELEAIALRYSSVSDLTRKRGYGAEMLIKIFNIFFNEIEKSKPSDSPLMQRILDLLNTSAGIRGGLPYVCKALQYSESYVSHRFKFHWGVTFSQYLKDTRLKYIEYYLKTTNYSLKNIADLVGIESLSYLNRIFKEKYNVTPLKYRKLYANPSPNPSKINQKRVKYSKIEQKTK